MIQSSVRRCALVAVALITLTARAAAQQSAGADVSLDSLLNTHISAASKYAQTGGDAPGSVTIVTSDDIKTFGYRNLQEVFENVRGFYVSNDRSYSYLGTRGFSRMSDYNSRVLMLIDGHSINDQLLGSTPIGADLPINLDAVERIEIVQGPGSALYGTGAMFAVINIVTKTTLALDGGAVRAGIGSAGERTMAFAGGHSFGDVSITGSGLFKNVKGVDQYYPEFDSPITRNGIARGLDWEQGASAYATLKWNALTIRSGLRSYSKGIPTAPYGMVFGEPGTQALGRNFWTDVAVRRDLTGSLTLSGRVYADRTTYEAQWPFDPGASVLISASVGTSLGTDIMLRWEPISRVRVTVGTEDRFVTHAAYSEHFVGAPGSTDNAPFHVLSGYAQSEIQVLPIALLVAGARIDRYSTIDAATTPRLGLILTPSAGTKVKLLYGEAFRAPSAAQASLSAGAFQENPTLRAERIVTSEINVQQRLGASVLFDASAYRYGVTDLIDQTFASGKITYRNLSSAHATGLELQLDVRPVGPFAAQVSYVLQNTQDAQHSTLTNSPHHVANVRASSRTANGIRTAVQLRYESARRTQVRETSSFLRTDANLGYRPPVTTRLTWLADTEIGLRVTNLLDVAYASPAAAIGRQDSIAADGRSYALRLEWRF